ncbi:MAG: TAXI family TRAP transporter solute-binding subunit, partial [Alphaproteobacteria bacterium]|nr:TAXI family TRAP transporter solute-binding subunit [Alphaproteobacteria bacterium]
MKKYNGGKMKKFIIGMFFLINSSSLYSTDFITLGTGEVNATYYPRGLFLCKLINEFQTENKIRCSVESTDGSVYNINAIDKGELNFAISQSDTVYNAVNGKKNFLNNEKEKIRSVISIYPELLTFIVSKKSGIKSIEDIEGKRINIGNPLSGSRVSTLKLFEKYGIKKEKLSLAGGLKIEDTADALRDDKIDGYFFMVGHPSQNIKDAVDSIPVSIIPLAGDKVNQLVEENPYF